MNKRFLLKMLSLFSVVRGYNILMIVIAQYLASAFILAPNLPLREVFFDDNESYHIIKVMRKKKGDIIKATDGNGILLEIKITFIKSNKLIGLLLKKINIKANKHSPDIGICIPKKTSRFEWFIEKATEIGIRNIYPIISHNTEKKI